jgi:hypothetical protein
MFTNAIQTIKKNKVWQKNEIVEIFQIMIPNFGHKETGKYLDAKM